MHHELKSVADSEHGQAPLENTGVCGRSVGVIDRARAPRKNYAHGRVAANLFQTGSTRQYHGKNVLFADAARDELRILSAEIKDDDGLGFHGRVSQIAGRV